MCVVFYGLDEVVMFIQCEYFVMEGLIQMIEVICGVMSEELNWFEFGGIFLMMFDVVFDLVYEVEVEVCDFFGEIVFEMVILCDV